jgi:hypothetical protein
MSAKCQKRTLADHQVQILIKSKWRHWSGIRPSASLCSRPPKPKVPWQRLPLPSAALNASPVRRPTAVGGLARRLSMRLGTTLYRMRSEISVRAKPTGDFQPTLLALFFAPNRWCTTTWTPAGDSRGPEIIALARAKGLALARAKGLGVTRPALCSRRRGVARGKRIGPLASPKGAALRLGRPTLCHCGANRYQAEREDAYDR